MPVGTLNNEMNRLMKEINWIYKLQTLYAKDLRCLIKLHKSVFTEQCFEISFCTHCNSVPLTTLIYYMKQNFHHNSKKRNTQTDYEMLHNRHLCKFMYVPDV